MRGVHFFWNLLINVINIFNINITKIYSLLNFHFVFDKTSINFTPRLYKLFLILFYGKIKSKNLGRLHLVDLNKLYFIRFRHYPMIHSFYMNEFSKKSQSSFTKIKLNTIFTLLSQSNSQINTKYQIILLYLCVEYYRYCSLHSYWIKRDIYTYVSIAEELVKYINNINHTLYKYNTFNVYQFNSKNVFEKSDTNSPRYVLNRNFWVITNQLSFNESKKNGVINTTTFENVLTKYNLFFKKIINNSTITFYNNIKVAHIFNNINNQYITVSNNFKKQLSTLFSIKYRPTDAAKYISANKHNNIISLFIRKNKIFNKGRYSRNRQLYRTGVYWCIWLNIICVFGLYYYFYRFVFNFGYLWIPFIIFIYSIFGSRLIKYRLYNPVNILGEFKNFLNVLTNFLMIFFLKVSSFIKIFSNNFVKYIKIVLFLFK